MDGAQIKNYFAQFVKETNNHAHACTGFWADNVIMVEHVNKINSIDQSS